jgi:hypothetical protein
LTSFVQNPRRAEAVRSGLRLRGRTFEPIVLFAIALAIATLAYTLLLVELDTPFGPLWAILALGALAAFVERQPVRLTPNLEITVSFLPLVFAAVTLGPLSAMAIVVLGLAMDCRAPRVRWLIWVCMRALAVGLAGAAALAILAQGDSFGVLVLAVTVASLTYSLIDTGLGSLVVAIRGSGDCVTYLRSLVPILAGTVPLYAPVILLLAYAYQELSAWSLLLSSLLHSSPIVSTVSTGSSGRRLRSSSQRRTGLRGRTCRSLLHS